VWRRLTPELARAGDSKKKHFPGGERIGVCADWEGLRGLGAAGVLETICGGKKKKKRDEMRREICCAGGWFFLAAGKGRRSR